jgi:hypothetical protein
MTREIHPATAAAALGDVVRPFLTIEMDYPDGMVRASTLQETVVIDGLTYYGMGALGEVSPLQEGAESRSYGAKVALSGIPGNFAAYLQSQDVQGRQATIRVGLMSHAYEIVGEMVTVFVGRMDTQDVSAGKNTGVEVAIESLLIDWERARVRRYTDVDQQAFYPGDRGFEYQAALQNMSLIWGR